MGKTSLKGVLPLWRRSPLWRSLVILALALNIIFALFPPERCFTGHSLPAPPLASYRPLPEQKSVSASSPVIVPPAQVAQQVQTPPVANSKPITPRSDRVSVPASPRPAMATLSLAGASDADQVEKDTGVSTAMLGRLYDGSIQTNDFTVPLPAGRWAMLATTTTHFKNDSEAVGTGYFLGRIRQKKLIGTVVISTLRTQSIGVNDVLKSQPCNYPTPLTIVTDDTSDSDIRSCWLIHSIFTPPWQQWADRGINMNPLDRAAAGDLAAKGVSYPQDLVAVQFVKVNKTKVLMATYMFNPESEGIMSTTALSQLDSDWVTSRIDRYPDKVAYLGKLKLWGETWWPRIQAGFADN